MMDVKKIFLIAVVSCVYFFGSANGAFCGDPIHTAPVITPETELITCYLSVTSFADGPLPGGDRLPVDRLPVDAPVNASVTQVMLLAQEHPGGEFTFQSDYHETWGSFIHTINGVSNDHPYYWFLYANDEQTNCGADYVRVMENDHIHWIYEKYVY